MTDRQRLPDRRLATTFTFQHTYPGSEPKTFTASVGHRPDGCVGEVFISLLDGTDKMSVDAHDAAVLLSLALQHGASLADMGKAMLRGEDGKPHGWVGAAIDAILAMEEKA